MLFQVAQNRPAPTPSPISSEALRPNIPSSQFHFRMVTASTPQNGSRISAEHLLILTMMRLTRKTTTEVCSFPRHKPVRCWTPQESQHRAATLEFAFLWYTSRL